MGGENRLLTTYQGYTPLEQYAYGVDNRRVYKRNVQPNAEQFFFWSGGQVLGIYSPNLDANEYMTGLTTVNTYTYFGSRRLGERLDYADQRYYSSTGRRFLTPDPGPAVLGYPESFNRYGYAWGDPVNANDLPVPYRLS